VLRALFRHRLQLTITGDGITDIIIGAITTDMTTVATIIDTALGLPAPVGIIAIGKRRHQGSHL
jgi:hypothetical protein